MHTLPKSPFPFLFPLLKYPLSITSNTLHSTPTYLPIEPLASSSPFPSYHMSQLPDPLSLLNLHLVSFSRQVRVSGQWLNEA